MPKTKQQLLEEIVKRIPIAEKGNNNLGFPYLKVTQYEEEFILKLKESSSANSHLKT